MVNDKIYELAKQADMIEFESIPGSTAVTPNHESIVKARKFAVLLIEECAARCEEVATDADTISKSTFVTEVGRMLHEGMWGGAKNCAVGIRQHFGVEE